MKIYGILVALLICVGFAGASVPVDELDYLNIGDVTSEAGHNVVGWSDVWTWGGNYGGGDDGNLGSQTLRSVIPRVPTCQQDDKTANFSMSTDGTASILEIRHLQGSQNDNYNLSFESAPGNWTQLTMQNSTNQYCSGGECWYTDVYYLESLTGTINFKVVATLSAIPSWCESWGINAFSWAKLSGAQKSEVPEFSTIAALVALVGAAIGVVVVRKRN